MAQHAAVECLHKLEEFEATVTFGKDLFKSTRSLLAYSFGTRKISDIFCSALSYPDHLEKCKEISKRLCSVVLSTLECLLVAERYTNEKGKISEEIELFWEVYQLKLIPNLLEPDQLSYIEKMLDSVGALVKEVGMDSSSGLVFPCDLLRLFIDKREIYASRIRSAKELPYFLKDVSVQHGCSPSTVVAESKPLDDFVCRMDKVLKDAEAGNVDVVLVKDLSDFHAAESPHLYDVVKIASRFASVMDNFSTWPCDTVAAFLAMFENFFQALCEEAKCSAMRLIYEKYLLKGRNLFSLENYLNNFSSEMTEYVNGIGDHNEIQSNPEKFDSIRKKISWYLLTVPGPTIQRLLSQCLQNKLIIFRSCGVLFDFTIKCERVPQEDVPVLVDSIISLFEKEVDRLTSTERQDHLIYLLTSLARRKRSTAKEKVEKSILDASALVRLFVMPNLLKRTHEVVMLRLLHRLTQSVGAKETHFEWTVTVGERRLNAVQTPELLLLVVELFMEYESENEEAAEICHSLLKSLGGKLKCDSVVFSKETTDFVLFSLRCYPWWIRYAICSWFSHTLSAPMQQIPTGLYKSLSLDQQELCEQITVDFPFSPAECFFRSLFELALFESDLALDFLRKGIVVSFRDTNLIEKIALALVDSCEQASYRQNLTALVPLLSELLWLLDPSQEVRFMESLCENTYHGLRLIKHILLLATAVKLAYHKENTNCSNGLPRPYTSCESESYTNRVAEIFLQAFCELTKAHADKEVVNLRRSRLPQPPDIKEDQLPPPHVKIRWDERVYAQLAVLFNVTCSLTRLIHEVPPSLKVLINCLTEYLFELQNLRLATLLDDLPSDHYKSNTVYAVAQADGKKLPNNKKEENSKKSDQCYRDRKSAHGEHESYSVENELFDRLGTTVVKMDNLATARQISAAGVRQLAENRLIGKESSVNDVVTTNGRENAGNFGKKRRSTKRR